MGNVYVSYDGWYRMPHDSFSPRGWDAWNKNKTQDTVHISVVTRPCTCKHVMYYWYAYEVDSIKAFHCTALHCSLSIEVQLGSDVGEERPRGKPWDDVVVVPASKALSLEGHAEVYLLVEGFGHVSVEDSEINREDEQRNSQHRVRYRVGSYRTGGMLLLCACLPVHKTVVTTAAPVSGTAVSRSLKRCDGSPRGSSNINTVNTTYEVSVIFKLWHACGQSSAQTVYVRRWVAVLAWKSQATEIDAHSRRRDSCPRQEKVK